MIVYETLLVTLVKLVGRIPVPPPPAMRGRGRPPTYPDRLFLQALVIMIVRHLHTVHELLSVLAQPTPEMQTLRALLTVGRPLSDAPHLGAAAAGHPRDPARPNRLSGAGAGGLDPAMGDVWTGGRDRQHPVAGPGGRMAQAGPRGRHRPPHLD